MPPRAGRERHEAYDLHCTNVTPTNDRTKSYHWTCKYCGTTKTSSATRLVQHLAQIGGQIAPCKLVPSDVAEKYWRECGKGGRRPPRSNAHDEVIPPTFEEPEDEAASVADARATSGTGSASASPTSKRPRPTMSRQTTLHQGGISTLPLVQLQH